MSRPSAVPFPSLDQVLELPSRHSLVVPQDYTDGNGHMNVARYMQIHSDGGWAYFAELGLSEESARSGGPTTFDVEHHIMYRREVHAGHRVAVHVRLIGRTDKAVHYLQFLVNETTAEVANSHEAVGLAVDLESRAITAIPDAIADQLDARIARDGALGWEAPLRMPLGQPSPRSPARG